MTHSFGMSRFRQAQMFFAFPLLLVSWAFMVAAERGTITMPADTFGTAAAQISALVWSFWQSTCALVMLCGIAVNGHRPVLSSVLRTAGAALLAAHFAALGWSAFAYGGGFFVAAFSAMFAGKALFFFSVGLIDVVTMWAWRRRHG